MSFLSNLFYGLGRPLIIGVILIVGLGLMSGDSTSGTRGADGFLCRGWTDIPDVNRAICRLNPARIWNTPIADLLN